MVTLRRHGADAPWTVGDLAALTDRLLAAAGAESAKPTTDRTVRFYVTRGVVQAPFGRGRGSSWGYPHLIELLAARLAQLDGEALGAIIARRARSSAEVLERHVATRLGVALPVPEAPVAAPEVPPHLSYHRFAVSTGVELHLQDDHPLLREPRRLGTVLDDLRAATGPSSEES